MISVYLLLDCLCSASRPKSVEQDCTVDLDYAFIWRFNAQVALERSKCGLNLVHRVKIFLTTSSPHTQRNSVKNLSF